VIPWIIFAVVVVPLAIVAFVASRRRTAAGERSTSEPALTEEEFEAAEASQAQWQEQEKERYHQERLP
jgi:hypothetical protein